MYKYLMGENEEEGASLFSTVPTDRTRGDGHKLKYMKFHLTQEYPFFTVRESLEQVAQRGCGVFLPGDTQNRTTHSPGRPVLADPA